MSRKRKGSDGSTDYRISQGTEIGRPSDLYGSVTASDVAHAVQEQASIELDRRKLIMPDQIKTLGEYSVTAKLHHDVEFPFTIEVVKA